MFTPFWNKKTSRLIRCVFISLNVDTLVGKNAHPHFRDFGILTHRTGHVDEGKTTRSYKRKRLPSSRCRWDTETWPKHFNTKKHMRKSRPLRRRSVICICRITHDCEAMYVFFDVWFFCLEIHVRVPLWSSQCRFKQCRLINRDLSRLKTRCCHGCNSASARKASWRGTS